MRLTAIGLGTHKIHWYGTNSSPKFKAVASVLFPELTKGYFKSEMARNFTQRPHWTQIPSCCLKSKQGEGNQTQMNEDVASVKQYSLPLLGNQRKEMNIIRSHHNPPKSITNNVEREGAYL